MDLQGLSSTPTTTNPSPGFAYTAANLRPSPPSSCSSPASSLPSGSAHSSPARVAPPIGSLSQSPPTDPCSPMASDFRALTVGRGRPAPARGPLNAVGWPIVRAVGANEAQFGVPRAPWRMPEAYETAVSRFAAQAIDFPFAARLPFEIMANDFLPVPPLPPPKPSKQEPTSDELLLRKHEQMLLQLDAQRLQDQLRLQEEERQAQQERLLQEEEWLQQRDGEQEVQLQQTTQWLEKLVECEEEGVEDGRGIEATPTICEEPTPTRWQQQCQISQDYLARSLESDEESELMAIMSQESSQDDEKPTDESACWQLAHPSWPRVSSIVGVEGAPAKSSSSRHCAKRRARDAAAAAAAGATAPEGCAAPSAEQQRNFRRFQERHPIEMTPESIDDYLFKSMNAEKERGGSKAQAQRQ